MKCYSKLLWSIRENWNHSLFHTRVRFTFLNHGLMKTFKVNISLSLIETEHFLHVLGIIFRCVTNVCKVYKLSNFSKQM